MLKKFSEQEDFNVPQYQRDELSPSPLLNSSERANYFDFIDMTEESNESLVNNEGKISI